MCNYTKKYFVACGFLLLILSGCDSYQKILKSPDLELKYTKAKEYYNKGDYYKAQPIFEELIGLYRGTKNIEDLLYYYAYCHYGQSNFILASYHFKNLVNTYPASKFAEESYYMNAFCYYHLSPVPNLDQTYTQKAIDAFQLFINIYPKSEKVTECNRIIDELREKLSEKAFSNAELYFRLGYYKSAATTLETLMREFPDYPKKERVEFLVIKSYYMLAERSIAKKKEERYNLAINAYYSFIDKYANSKFVKEAEQIYESSVKGIKKNQER
ncbi:MAG: outer membrane protein assembly factor BamD [Bacteroidetes bacterium]|nr:outer membrane protein assembly factor BamD [Bacteroidota bacterium]